MYINLLHAVTNGLGVFSSPIPITSFPDSRILVANLVKSLSLEIKQNPSTFSRCRISIASIIIAESVEFLPEVCLYWLDLGWWYVFGIYQHCQLCFFTFHLYNSFQTFLTSKHNAKNKLFASYFDENKNSILHRQLPSCVGHTLYSDIYSDIRVLCFFLKSLIEGCRTEIPCLCRFVLQSCINFWRIQPDHSINHTNVLILHQHNCHPAYLWQKKQMQVVLSDLWRLWVCKASWCSSR